MNILLNLKHRVFKVYDNFLNVVDIDTENDNVIYLTWKDNEVIHRVPENVCYNILAREIIN